MELTLTNDNFTKEVLESDIPVMVDFWAAWCGPCRMVGPFIEQVANEFSGKAKVGKVNIDEQEDLAAQYGIMTIPTIMVFHKGEIVDKVVGAVPKSTLTQMLNKLV
jgi:thioredoxin 1